jgi:hypothetical protein
MLGELICCKIIQMKKYKSSAMIYLQKKNVIIASFVLVQVGLIWEQLITGAEYRMDASMLPMCVAFIKMKPNDNIQTNSTGVVNDNHLRRSGDANTIRAKQ